MKNNKLYAYPGNDFCSNDCTCLGKGHELSEGMVACMMSHHNVWKDIVDKNYKRALIIEDDIILKDDCIEIFNKTIKEIPDNWQLLYPGFILTNMKYLINDKSYLKIDEGLAGTYCYGIKLKTSKLFSSLTYPVRAASDGFIAKIVSKKLDNIYVFKNRIGEHGSNINIFSSSI